MDRRPSFTPGAADPVPVPPSGGTIVARLEELALLTDEAGVLTRLYLSPAHRKAVDLAGRWMREAGMTTRVDGAATLIGRYEGAAPGAPALIVGSHIDTVRNAGRFDGNLGVVLAIEAVRACHAAGLRFPFALEVVAFGDEEGVRFPSTLSGSRALAGRFDSRLLDERDGQGVSRRDALTAFGCDPSAIRGSARSRADTVGYVEVHIEQGPVLERRGCPVGVVTAINGATRGTVRLSGKSGHAGTTPMNLRRDALAAAAEIVVMVERHAHGCAGLLATVGRLEVPNGAANTVPGAAALTLDIRSPADEVRRQAVDSILAGAREIAARRSLAIDVDIGHEAPAAPCDPRFIGALTRAVRACGLPLVLLPSGAGHDAMAFRGVLPFGMLFVRCRDGLSHHPDEYADPADMETAARVLSEFICTFEVAGTPAQ